MQWLAVALGGALGSMARHGLNLLIQDKQASGAFPLGIFAINVLGRARHTPDGRFAGNG